MVTLLFLLVSLFRKELALENLALRQQLAVMKRLLEERFQPS